jgi:hypothetical protein
MDAIDEHARRLAQALQGTGGQAGLSAGPEVAPLRGALRRRRRSGFVAGTVSRRSGPSRSARWPHDQNRRPGCLSALGPGRTRYLAPPVRGPYAAGAFGYGGQGGFSAPRRKLVGADRVGAILGVGGGGIGLCIGAAAAATAAIPSSALWMSAIVCDSGYQMAYSTSDYTSRASRGPR